MGKEDNTRPFTAVRRNRRRESRHPRAVVDPARKQARKTPVKTIISVEVQGTAYAEAIVSGRVIAAAEGPTRHAAIREVGIRLARNGHPIVGMALRSLAAATEALVAEARSRLRAQSDF